MTLRVTVDYDRCTGHGRCYSLAPTIFDCDDEGRPVVLLADVPDDLEDDARIAVVNCPEQAIAVSPA